MDRLQKYREAFRALPNGCTGAEVSARFVERMSVSGQKGDTSGCEATESNALFLRVNAGGTGTVYTESLEDDPTKLLLKATENAKSIPGGVEQPLKTGRRERPSGEKEQLRSPQELRLLTQELSLWEEIERCTVSQEQQTVCVLNTNGVEISHTATICEIELSVCGKGEDNFKTYHIARNRFSDFDIPNLLRQIRQECAWEHDELPYMKLKSGRYRAVVSNSVVINIMNTAWQLFAQRLINSGKSPFSVGMTVGNSVFSVVDAAIMPEGGYDFSLDAEGVRGSTENFLVKDGVMCETLRTLADGNSTGNAGRDDLLSGMIHTEVISIPRNISIVAGSKLPEELLAEMGTGIHLTYSMDEFHSTNITEGTFTIPCGGVYYENGKPVGRVQQMNMYGKFSDLFTAVEAVGNDTQMRPMDTYRSYCFGGPSLLVNGVQFTM